MSNRGVMHLQDLAEAIEQFAMANNKFFENSTSLSDWLEIIRHTEKAYQERLKAHRAVKRTAKKARFKKWQLNQL